MKVLFAASDNNSSSGAFRSMVALNKILNTEFGVETLVVLPEEGDGAPLLEQAGVRYTVIRSFGWVIADAPVSPALRMCISEQKKLNSEAVRLFLRLIEEEKIDIVHINTSYSYVAALAAHIANKPIVWHLREFLEEDQGKRIYDRRGGYALISASDRIVAISQALYKKYEGILPKEKMRVIYNGIDEKVFWKPEKKIFRGRTLEFVCAGAINSKKGQEELLRACGKLYRGGFSDFRLRFAGTYHESDRARLEAIAEEYGIRDKYELLGKRLDVDKLFECADIVFMCSQFEAFGRVTVEGMLSGALVIGADTGGTAEILQDGKTGYWYRQGDAESLCSVIQKAVQSRVAAAAVAARGRDYALAHFTARHNAEQIAQMYKELRPQRKIPVAAVVVTYNRKEMLKECIAALLAQTYPGLEIFIVDNASTDGTRALGEALSAEEVRVHYCNTGKNLGGAGGFHYGMKEAYDAGAERLWVMDDDVLPQPDALERLVAAEELLRSRGERAGFFAGCVYGPSGEPMNTPGIDRAGENGYAFWYEHLENGLVRLDSATFVSVLFPREAVGLSGLPCSDFFIWGDDTEYTMRVRRVCGSAYLVGGSNAVHARANAKNLTIFNEEQPRRVGMFAYMVRNTLIYTSAYAGQTALASRLHAFRGDCRRLRLSRDPLRKEKIAAIRQGIRQFKKYDFGVFGMRYELFPLRLPPAAKENFFRRAVCFLPRSVKRLKNYRKKYGTRALIKRILYGKKCYGIHYTIGRAVTWLPRKLIR